MEIRRGKWVRQLLQDEQNSNQNLEPPHPQIWESNRRIVFQQWFGVPKNFASWREDKIGREKLSHEISAWFWVDWII